MVGLLPILETAANAVVPIVLLILLGYLLRRKGFLSGGFIRTGSKLVFKLLIPVMLFVNVYEIESLSAIRWDVALYCVGMVLLLFLAGLFIIPLTTKVPERRGVILQCMVRSNTAVIGLSLAATLGSTEAVAVTSVASAFTVPVLNVLGIVALTIYVDRGDDHKLDIRGILNNIAANPLITGIALGMCALAIRMMQEKCFGRVVFSIREDMTFLYTALNNLKAITSPLALLVLGGQFEFGATRGLLKEITAGTLLRVVIAPLIGIGAAVMLTNAGVLSFGVHEYPALIAIFGSPVAVSSAIMAGQMNNDEQLATQLVVWTSICSIATMFLTVCVLMTAGLLAA